MKKLIAAALAVVMIVAQTSCSKKSDKDDNEYIYGQIESVSGNDVTLEIVNYNEKSDDSESDDTSDSDNSGSSKRSRPLGMSKQGGSKNSNYTLTGEKKEIRIPVGVTVTTSSGVKSSFDALKKGDIIKLSVEKDSSGSETVKEVWIMKK